MKGKAPPPDDGQAVRQSPETQTVVAASEVVVAFVPVAFLKVRSWKVEEALEKRPFVKPTTVEVETKLGKTVKGKVPDPPVGQAVLQSPPIQTVVAEIEVVVALVEVEFRAVKFCRVEEPFARRFANVPNPDEVMAPAFQMPVVMVPRVVIELCPT